MSNKPLLIRLLYFTLIFNLGYSIQGLGQATPDCPEIRIEVQVTNTSDNQNNGMIELKGDDNQKYKVFLLSGDGKNSLEASDKELENLKKGEYNLIVQNGKGCSKLFKIKIG